MQTRPASSLEILESRIAPALFFIQSNALTVLDVLGVNAQNSGNENTAKSEANSTTAVLLAAGDKLIFDADHNHIQNAGDEVLVSITAGHAMIFLTDKLGAVDGHFDENEISGLAVSAGFNGTINADVRGSIVTADDPMGTFTASGGLVTLQHGASIVGLTVKGKLGGAVANTARILAGGSISNVSVGTSLISGGTDISVDGTIQTGGAADSAKVSFNGGGKTFFATFTALAGENGGSITNVHLDHSVLGIEAGTGGSSPTVPGKGGSITNLTIASQKGAVTMISGGGGSNTGAGAGGAAGKFTGIHITGVVSSADILFFVTTNAGTAKKGVGGAGGTINDFHLDFTGTASGIFVASGAGGLSSDGAGGPAGSIVGSTIHVGSMNANLHITAGSGGKGGLTGAGGLGGSINGLTLTAGAVPNPPAGASPNVTAGNGGDGGANGNGGKGGALTGSNITFKGEITGSLTVGSGHGGSGGFTKGAGGNGGTMSATTVTTKGVTVDLLVHSGTGADGYSAAGGNGGALTGVTVENQIFIQNLFFNSGRGADVISGNGNGGKGGNASNLTYKNTGGVDKFTIAGQTGGTGNATGNGGNSGALSAVTVISVGDVFTSGMIGSYNNLGSAGATLGNGGNGGKVSGITFHDQAAGGVGGDIFIFGGDGGSASGATGKGGTAGNIVGVTLDSTDAKFFIGEDTKSGGFRGHGGTGGTGATAIAGAGSSVSNVHGTAGDLVVLGRDGGTATNGTGGKGGNVTGVTITNATALVTMISGGNGGNGAVKAGVGGSVSTVNVAGDIGRFNQSFNATIGSTGMGGLFAGQTGLGGGLLTNGNITNVTAARIAAILAGHPTTTGLQEINAVNKISGVHVTSAAAGSHLGADVNGTGFSFTNAGSGGLNPGDGDTMIDGFVIALKSGLIATSFGGAVPLFLIQVV